jgi:hypothetical protein
MKTKICAKCGIEKNISKFYLRKTGYRDSYCKPCKTKTNLEWSRNNIEKNREKARKWWRKKNGTNPENYRALP